MSKTDQPGDGNDVRDAAHTLAEDVVGDAEGLGDGQRGVDGVEEATREREREFFCVFWEKGF